MADDSQSADSFLRCPQCRSNVIQDGDRLVCTNTEQRLAYPIRDGIPVMIVDEAETLSSEEWNAAISRHQSRSQA